MTLAHSRTLARAVLADSQWEAWDVSHRTEAAYRQHLNRLARVIREADAMWTPKRKGGVHGDGLDRWLGSSRIGANRTYSSHPYV